MGKRILTALVAIPALFLLVIAGGRTGTALVVAVASFIGVKEFLALAPSSKNALEKSFAPFWGALTALCFLVSSETAPLAATAAGVVLFLVARAAKEGVGADVLQSGFRVFAAWLYVPLSIGFAVTVRGNAWEPIVFLILLVIAGDTAAYFTGISLGRHRLAPSISPKKTIEGSVGGFLFTVATGYFLATVMRVPHSPVESMGIAALLNVAAQLGDLGESVLKRGAGVKDSGTVFPGHGGMLDRIDSFVPTLPIYAFILSVTGGLP